MHIRISAVSTLDKGVGAETGFKDYKYNYLHDNFKVIVVDFKSFCKK
jgi:hypothetical protein